MRPDIAKTIALMLWFTDNEILTQSERKKLDDAVMVLRDLAFTHLETDNDKED